MWGSVFTQEDDKSESALITVVIPTFNRGEDLRIVLDALKIQTDQRLAVVVVDNSSTDNTAIILSELIEQEWGSRLRHIIREPNGPASARNTGLAEASSEFVLFLDSDVELAPDWIELALVKMRADEMTAAVGGLILYEFDRSRVNAYGGDLGRFGLAWDIAEGAMQNEVTRSAQRIWINCSAMLARTKEIRHVGGFDEQYFYGFEDSDIGWKLNLAGNHLWVLPELHAYHHVDPEPGQTHPDIVFHFCKNRLRSMLKNASPTSLVYMLGGYIIYTLVDTVMRGPRAAKLRAIIWNIRKLPETIKLRKQIQSLRKTADTSIFRLGEGRWFPPSTLAGQRRRQPEGVVADRASVTNAHKTDDRV